MKNENITNELAKNISKLPKTVCASMIAYTFGCTKATAAKSLESLVAMGLLNRNGLIYSTK